MSDAEIYLHEFANGLTLVAEPMSHRRAAAFTLLLPAGALTEPEGREGLSSVVYGLAFRGAGERDSRALSDALDSLGLQRSGGAGLEHTSFGGALLADHLPEALALYADIVRRPHLPEDQLEAERALALQELANLEDNPSKKLFVELQRTYFPGPHGRSPLGTEEGLKALSIGDVQADHARRYRPQGAILAVAGGIEWEPLRDRVEELFGDWEGEPPALPSPAAVTEPVYRHLEQQTEQHQIGVIYSEVAPDHPDYYEASLTVRVLSGGMGARLFTELREKEGLCYAVFAQYMAVKKAGFVYCYVGTQPDRSQRSLDKLMAELRRLAEGVTSAELERARTGMLAAVVMQGESTPARASAIASEYYLRGHVRTLDEIRAAVERVTLESIQRHLTAHPPREFTVVTIGPGALTVPQ